MEREGTLGGRCNSGKRFGGPNSSKKMWPVQIFGSQRNDNSSEVTPNASKLLGSRDKGLQSQWKNIED